MKIKIFFIAIQSPHHDSIVLLSLLTPVHCVNVHDKLL